MTPLIRTNPYLSDPAMREIALRRNVVSSSAIDGIRVFQLLQCTNAPEQVSVKSVESDSAEPLTPKQG